ncbi:helix-turn-helix domain-containing protein [Dyella sp. A6]|uniref:helix-turn-helix domain-containing protein n=1 Tax=Dyella aluminiiresistens TaxID=3069105 RepID=UPI002E78AF63|nr:helix-turn-helix domain-containing protein [Dyella sp. A6]
MNSIVSIEPSVTHAPRAVAHVSHEPQTLPTIDIDELRTRIPVVQRKLEAGQYLYHAGQPFQALFLVHAGFLKNCLVAEDGREQVTGFRMRGDLMGVESIGAPTHSCDAIALDSCTVWELPYPAILGASLQMPELHAQLTAALAAEIRSDRSWMLALGTMSAEQRVAAFLLDVAARHEALGFSAHHFVLRMSRADIGSFLALKHETVTRALARLIAQGCISVQWREVRILDEAALRVAMQNNTRVH